MIGLGFIELGLDPFFVLVMQPWGLHGNVYAVEVVE